MFIEMPIDPDVKQLSRRERQVADLIVAGRTGNEVALELGLSRHTVNEYTKGLFRKLGIHRRAMIAPALAQMEEAA